ncbi:MAG: ABC transporter substrate-binding protein [Bacteroidales bacterium]|nr:ABC transporter substrate-binding protein [Bacteroidales bacterium]
MQLLNQDNYPRSFNWKPNARIISLVPSITELLYDLGMWQNIVARTKYCVHPKDILSEIIDVGGTKTIDIDRIVALRPDIVIANKEENNQAQIEALQKLVYVELTHIKSYAHALHFIEYCGQLFQQQNLSKSIVVDIRKKFDKIDFNPTKKLLYLIWRKPYMSITKSTYIHSILSQLGFDNIIADFDDNYPILESKSLKKLSPEIIFLPSEPYSFTKEHAADIAQFFPKAKIFFVDGEMFSWYGTRMLKAADYFMENLAEWKS